MINDYEAKPTKKADAGSADRAKVLSKPNTVSRLNELIVTCKDGEAGSAVPRKASARPN